jgi:hypothetical protein
MAQDIKEAKAAPVERPAEADQAYADRLGDSNDKSRCFVNSKYLTFDITNGNEATIEELRQRFPRIQIFKVPHPILGNPLSIYSIDRNKLTIENYEMRLKK